MSDSSSSQTPLPSAQESIRHSGRLTRQGTLDALSESMETVEIGQNREIDDEVDDKENDDDIEESEEDSKEPKLDEVRRLQNEVKTLKRRIDELVSVVGASSSMKKSHTARSEGSQAVRSEHHQDEDSISVSMAASPNDMARELIRLIPRYDGNGGMQKFMEFAENFEDYASNVELSATAEMTLARAKLTGDAKMWLREQMKDTSIDSPEWIQNWEMLSKV